MHESKPDRLPVGQKLSEAWGQPVIVENKPGANGNVGTPEMRENLGKQGAEVRTSAPNEFATFIRDEKVKWAKVVKDANVKVE